jgi:hypothetical protein
MFTETKMPAKDDAGTTDTNNARNSVLRALMGCIALLLASPRSKRACESSVTGRSAGTICINAVPRIMLLANHPKVTSGDPAVLRLSTIYVDGYPTFAARALASACENSFF